MLTGPDPSHKKLTRPGSKFFDLDPSLQFNDLIFMKIVSRDFKVIKEFLQISFFIWTYIFEAEITLKERSFNVLQFCNRKDSDQGMNHIWQSYLSRDGSCPTRVYLRPVENKGANRLWPRYCLTQLDEIFSDTKV